MTDRHRLRLAIRNAKSPGHGNMTGGVLRTWLDPKDLAVLIEAAESTLPSLMWGVSLVGGGWVHFDEIDEAIAAVKEEALGGRAVVIEHRRPS